MSELPVHSLAEPLISLGHSIPIHDPHKALQFCRALARALSPVDSALGRSEVVVELSVVCPVFNEGSGIDEFLSRLTAVLQSMQLPYEIILVDDGSHDASVERIGSWIERDPRIILIELARNFGHQMAISAGLEHARGKAVAVMDSDLQDPPEVLPTLYAKYREGFGVVYGVRENRKEGVAKRVLYHTFYRVLKLIATVSIPLNAGDFCIMDGAVVAQLVAMPERNRFLRGIRSWIGYRQIGVPYDREARFADIPKYTYGRLVNLALDGIISFGFRPLRAISLIGMAISIASVILACFYVYRKVHVGLTPPGFATTIVSILFLAGVQLMTIGLIGEYVGRIFEEVKHRPLYVVRRVQRAKSNS